MADDHQDDKDLPALKRMGEITPTRAALAPVYHTQGVLGSALTGWRASAQANAIDKLTLRYRAEDNLFRAQLGVVEAYVARERAVERLQDLDAILGHDQRQRDHARATEARQYEHNEAIQKLTHEAQVLESQMALERTRQLSASGLTGEEFEARRRLYEADVMRMSHDDLRDKFKAGTSTPASPPDQISMLEALLSEAEQAGVPPEHTQYLKEALARMKVSS